MNSLRKPKLILNVLSTIGVNGGVPNKVMDIYRQIDKTKYQFHFFIYSDSDINASFEKEILNLGGKIHYFGRIREIGVLKFHSKFYKLLCEHDYHVIHSYNGINDGLLLYLSKLTNIKKRISHSRGADINSVKKKILAPILRFLVIKNANILLACSEKAGKFLFGNEEYSIIPNPVSVNKFINFNPNKSMQLKDEFDISDNEFILGHIGRFAPEKNHDFILKIAQELVRLDIKFKIILVGDGELKDSIENKVVEMNIEDNIIFAGNRRDIEDFYGIFDLLLFPSIHEGFGNVAVESQIANKVVIASTNVSSEVDLGLGLIKFLDINNLNKWIETIIKLENFESHISMGEITDAVQDKDFSIDFVLQEYYTLYN